LWAKGFVAASEWSAVALTYMYGKLEMSVLGVRVADWRAGGFRNIKGRPDLDRGR
jgi:hypothetical protein